jgi:hypothetical protein
MMGLLQVERAKEGEVVGTLPFIPYLRRRKNAGLSDE